MSDAYGRTFEPGGVGPGAASDTYPYKYLKSRSSLPQFKARPGHNRAPAFQLATLFPILVLLILSITFRSDDVADGFDWQLGMRIAGYSLAALSVLLALGMRKLQIDRLLIGWALVPVFVMLSSVYAVDGVFSLTAGLAHLVLLLFAWRMVTRLGHAPVVLAIVISGLVIGALSIFAFYAFPDLGRSAVEAYSADPAGRMRGVTPQPNTLGAVAAFTALLSVMYFKQFTARQRVIAATAILISAFCLVYSDSRTSIATLALCLLLWWLRRSNVALNLFTIVAIALAASLVVTFVPDVSAYLTRGDAGPTDLSSLNGRSRIWDVAWESIYAHPWLGRGYGASRLILPMDDRLFGAAVNTHNVYMELLFSGGLVLFGIFVLVVAGSVFRSVIRGRAEALIALLFFLIRGAAEAAPFAGLPLFAAFVFYTAVALCLSGADKPIVGAYARPRPINAGRLTAVPGRAASPLR